MQLVQDGDRIPHFMMEPNKLLARAFLLLAMSMGAATVSADAPKLVPDKASGEPNYWCTWYAQNYWIGRGTDLKSLDGVTNEAAREELTETAVFNPDDGWATTYLPRGRKDFIFLIDHGWQTKDKAKRIAGGPDFFNLVAEETDFPRYAELEPKDRLQRFNEDIRSLGWNSLGIWTRGNVTLAQARTFVEWSKHAGIRYWKIDGGDTREFNSFKAKQEIYPELVLEYVTGPEATSIRSGTATFPPTRRSTTSAASLQQAHARMPASTPTSSAPTMPRRC